MNEELVAIFEEDQSDRKSNPQPDLETGKRIFEHDKQHIERLKEILDKGGDLHEPEDFFHAAYIFQHGSETDEYKMANEMAQKAVELSELGTELNQEARKIYAYSLDRWLLSEGKLQKFGTQTRINDSGEWELAPYDPTTTDEERKEYFIPPLAK